MDQPEPMSALDEYFDYCENTPATIDPELLQTSAPSSAFDLHIEQEEQPAWEGQGWPAQPFGSDPEPLAQHIKGTNKDLVPQYPCSECPAYQGKNGFKRKDNLKQHLMYFHNYDDDKLATLLPSRRTRRFTILVCHYENCEYYRGPDFKGMGIQAQEKNRPFHKQSDYTRHMKDEHDCLNVAPKTRSGAITVKNGSPLATLRHTNDGSAEGKLHAAIATNSCNPGE
ncbi:hypothetical protein EKO27_g4186 [Xylaria grammica]|uniref:C2H2-type domain-containing protein n=1 Tax=Xylaria grammica TaxID=363999 RepID=A0A439D933_9PEZI|nr:hypothetical protein EKO27_g4186 [Xylaria grammica]